MGTRKTPRKPVVTALGNRRGKAKPLDDDSDGLDHRHELRDGDGQMTAMWAMFARVKYWSAKHRGPRVKPAVPDEEQLRRLTERLIDVLDEAWRAGWKGEDLAKTLFTVIKGRGG